MEDREKEEQYEIIIRIAKGKKNLRKITSN
jgi:hypothetical protein